MSLRVGGHVDVVGGTHEGSAGSVTKLTEKQVYVKISNGKEVRINQTSVRPSTATLDPITPPGSEVRINQTSVRPSTATLDPITPPGSATPASAHALEGASLRVGGHVDVVGGTHEGSAGTVTKLTEKQVYVKFKNGKEVRINQTSVRGRPSTNALQTPVVVDISDSAGSNPLVAHWSTGPPPSQGYKLMSMHRNPAMMDAFQDMFNVEDPNGLTGADRPNATHTHIKVFGAWRIENPALMQFYQSRKAKVKQDCERLGWVPQSVEPGVSKGRRGKFAAAYDRLEGSLDHNINEVRLLHGTKPETVLNIVAEGMNERYAGASAGALYGEGTYLADVVDKIDQYTKPDNGTETELHSRIYRDGVQRPSFNQKDICYAFVVRAQLGVYVRTQDGETSMDSPHQKLFPVTERELCVIEHPKNEPKTMTYHSLVAETGGRTKRHREYVFFRAMASCYPEYLVAYRRV